MSKPIENAVFFVNSNGSNDHVYGCLQLLKQNNAKVTVTALAIEESLPDYANFPSPQRKSRLEEILANATKNELEKFSAKAAELGFATHEPVLLSGRFPTTVEDWLKTNKPDVLIKQSLPCDGNFGFASKGDVKLARHTPVPLLLLHATPKTSGPVLLGLPHIFEEPDNRPFCKRLLENALQWCQLLGTSLHVVHAWHMFGENLMRSRIPEEELREELEKVKSGSAAKLKALIDETKADTGVNVKLELHKGDPTRILSGEIDVVQPCLVVMGSAANEGIRGVLLGNTAESILRRKETSVLVIH